MSRPPHTWELDSGPGEAELVAAPAWLLEASTGPSQNGKAARIETVIPEGRRNKDLASIAGTLRRRGFNSTEILVSLREVNKRCKPAPLEERELAAIAESYGEREADLELGKPAYTGPGRELAEVVSVFRSWLHFPDAGALYATLATVTANRLPGDPLWLLLVAASGGGKTELIQSLGGLEEVVPAAVLTEAALLSGTSRRETAPGASGGLLRQVGDFGLLTLKDFSGVLSMHREARASVLAALREVFDGSWTRHIGTDGGRTLHWEGKLGLIAGVTPAVDRHHAAISALGERFCMYRLEIDDPKAQGRAALSHLRRERGMRQELRDAVSGFFSALELPGEAPELSEGDIERLVALAHLVAKARSAVERDTYVTREIELVGASEAPGRLVTTLARLLDGLRAIGLDESETWRVVTKIGLDSLPAQRLKVLEHLLELSVPAKTNEIAAACDLPTSTAKRVLEDLAAHTVLVRYPGGEGKADTWCVAPWTRSEYAAATSPEMSVAGASELTRFVG